MNENNKGVPLRDGSGQGTRENFNRGGSCDGESCEISDMVRQQYREKVD